MESSFMADARRDAYEMGSRTRDNALAEQFVQDLEAEYGNGAKWTPRQFRALADEYRRGVADANAEVLSRG